MIYDFIDIGTSDFRYTIPRDNQKGIYVEPIGMYLDKIPEFPNTIKIKKAICKTSGFFEISYLHPKILSQYGLPDWLRGCNQVYNTHPTIIKECKKKNLDYQQILTKETIECITLYELFDLCKVKEIKALKIDTEGNDCAIVEQAVDLVKNGIKIHTINFESNSLTKPEVIKSTCDLLENHNWRKIKADGIHDTKYKKDYT